MRGYTGEATSGSASRRHEWRTLRADEAGFREDGSAYLMAIDAPMLEGLRRWGFLDPADSERVYQFLEPPVRPPDSLTASGNLKIRLPFVVSSDDYAASGLVQALRFDFDTRDAPAIWVGLKQPPEAVFSAGEVRFTQAPVRGQDIVRLYMAPADAPHVAGILEGDEKLLDAVWPLPGSAPKAGRAANRAARKGISTIVEEALP